MRIFLIAALTALFSIYGQLALSAGLPSVESSHWPNQYDKYFRKYSKRYFGANFDWQWFKAQAIAESHLKPNAKSRVGAKGIMQIMPSTYKDIQKSNPHFKDLNSPRWNIAAGIYYDRMLFRKWQKGLPEHERLMMAFASYNAGLGNILKAYKRSPKPVAAWDDIAPRAPRETRGYVKRIKALKKEEIRTVSKHGKGIWKVLAINAQKETEAN